MLTTLCVHAEPNAGGGVVFAVSLSSTPISNDLIAQPDVCVDTDRYDDLCT